MANMKSFGALCDANLAIETGITITAGSLIWADISGTNIVHTVFPYSATTREAITHTGIGQPSFDTQLGTSTGVFLGVIARTQTGIGNMSGGSQTGLTWFTEGCFDFATTPTASCAMRIGQVVYATRHDTVRGGFSGIHASLAGITGLNPIGVVAGYPQGGSTVLTSSAGFVRVKIFPFRTIQASV